MNICLTNSYKCREKFVGSQALKQCRIVAQSAGLSIQAVLENAAYPAT